MIDLVILGLAGWRYASLLVHEEGPGRVFVRLRLWAQGPRDGRGYRPTPFVGVLACVWCCSFWTTGALGALWLAGITWPAAIGAAWAIAVLCESWTASRSNPG